MEDSLRGSGDCGVNLARRCVAAMRRGTKVVAGLDRWRGRRGVARDRADADRGAALSRAGQRSLRRASGSTTRAGVAAARASFLKWQLTRERGFWPEWVDERAGAAAAGAGRRRADAGHVHQSRDAAAAVRRRQHPHRSDLVGALLAGRRSSGRSGIGRRGSASTICRRSTSCWSATITTTISTSRRCAACVARTVRAS